jgi:uncharacterized protein (TIGR00369 family)
MQLKMDIAALAAFLVQEFPQVCNDFVIADLQLGQISVDLVPDGRHLRPGGTVSGPAMFALADVGAYLLVLAHIGPQALAVTSGCSIDFMRKPPAGAILRAEARLLKLGRTLAFCDVMIMAEGQTGPVARASVTYALPI